MAMSKEMLEGIISRDLPGHELASGPEGLDAFTKPIEADSIGLPISALKEKFLGPNADQIDTGVPDGPVNDGDVIVVVRPTGSSQSVDGHQQAKAVVVSGRQERVIGSQG